MPLPATLVPDAPTAEPTGLRPGASLGPFTLARRLGEGATGEVWEAVDRRFDAPVALKVLTTGRAQLGRVMAEARAQSRIVSDHVVYVREAGEIDGVCYLAMALCREETATDAAPRVARPLTEEAPRSLAEAVAWGEQIARGVAAAHAAGVFHRDLKPDNVLVLPGSRKVRIADFGLAPIRGAGPGRRDEALLVPPGCEGPVLAGTPVYMAPEQARGFRRAPDPARDAEALAAIDVFGVGATLWAVLAGRQPRRMDDELEVARRRAATEVPPPLDQVETTFPVPPRLARIIEKATALDPVDRYDSAEALALDLAAFRAGRPTSLDAPLSPVRGWLWARRHPARLAAAAWVIAVAAGLASLVEVRARTDAANAELGAVEERLAAAEARERAVGLVAVVEGRRADAAADAANASARRAETAEERAVRLRRYATEQGTLAQAATEAERVAREAEAAARAAEGTAREEEARARSDEAAAREAAAAARVAEAAARESEREARVAEVAARESERAARSAEAAARSAEDEARAAERVARGSEAAARAVAADAASEAEQARAGEGAARAEAERARREAAEHATAAARASEALAAAKARAEAAEARLAEVLGAGPVAEE